MPELVRVLRGLRRAADDPRAIFAHRLRVGVAIAALIFFFSFLR
jgi:hypothetical protein